MMMMMMCRNLNFTFGVERNAKMAKIHILRRKKKKTKDEEF